MGRLPNNVDYEDQRKSRILENQARLESLGLYKTLSDLRSLTAPTKSTKTHKRKWIKKTYENTSLRRSDRIKQITTNQYDENLRRSGRLQSKPISPNEEESEEEDKAEKSATHCNSKGWGSDYDPIFGICCHLCRKKKLCGEDDCKRCVDRDPDQPCMGKTDCSVCHSGNGVYCRACLKVRYGEELEDVRENEEWMCPHCIEEKGTRPYWICNSSFCMRKRKLAPTGIAIFRAREMGYKSVAHLLMDKLQKRKKLGH